MHRPAVELILSDPVSFFARPVPSRPRWRRPFLYIGFSMLISGLIGSGFAKSVRHSLHLFLLLPLAPLEQVSWLKARSFGSWAIRQERSS
jgi:hypothetical protein